MIARLGRWQVGEGILHLLQYADRFSVAAPSAVVPPNPRMNVLRCMPFASLYLDAEINVTAKSVKADTASYQASGSDRLVEA
jgi:hypothetical protein